MNRYLLLTVAISGFLWVMLGAMMGHHVFSDIHASYFEKAQRYQIVHTLALFTLVTASVFTPMGNWLLATALAWIFGMICFSGSLYVMALTGTQAIRFVVPMGGVAFMIGWALLAVMAWKAS